MANYYEFEAAIKRAEGGYQNLKSDPGNKNSLGEYVGTNFGVSAAFYEGVIGRPPTVADMKAITQSEAHDLFKKRFWDKIFGDYITSQKVAETMADHAINAGTGSAVGVMQDTLNNYFNKSLIVDRGMGNLTLSAINSVNAEQLFIAFSQQRIADYKTKANCSTFCNIWFNRVESLADDHGVDLNKVVEPIKELASKKKSNNCTCGYSLFGSCTCVY